MTSGRRSGLPPASLTAASLPATSLTATDIATLQRRTLAVLSTSTVLGGLGMGAALSVGSLLLAEVSGNDAISGLASAMFNAGSAAAGVPLARIAMRHGRRRALMIGSGIAFLGCLIAIFGATIAIWQVLALGIGMIGVAVTVQLLSRFSATDLAPPHRRARDLSFVVWMITIGAVVGPNLLAPGAAVGNMVGVPALAGVFVFAACAQALATVVIWRGLRPDPLLAARALASDVEQPVDSAPAAPAPAAPTSSAPTPTAVIRSTHLQLSVQATRTAQWLIIAVIAVAQMLMVGLMSMTPLHLMHTGGTPEIVGVTLSLHIAGMYALAPVFGYLTNRAGRLPTIAIGIALLAAAVWLSYIAGSNHLTVQIALTVLGLGWSAVTVAGAVLLTDITPAEVRPKWQGLSDTFMSASGAVAAALAGIAFAIGDFSLLAAFAGTVLVVGVGGALWLAMMIMRTHTKTAL